MQEFAFSPIRMVCSGSSGECLDTHHAAQRFETRHAACRARGGVSQTDSFLMLSLSLRHSPSSLSPLIEKEIVERRLWISDQGCGVMARIVICFSSGP